MLYKSHIDTPLGTMIALASDHAIHMLLFEDRSWQQSLKSITQQLKMPIVDQSHPILHTLQQELNAYFRGNISSFKTPLLHIGTPFQQTVWSALRTIPYGQTISYKEIAQVIGKPTAYRAVALANRSNAIAILTPCHRVIKHDGQLCGYNGGLKRKQQLLAHESIQ